MPERPRILVSNDDGYRAEGLAALVEALEALAEVWVVAPESEQSATSHSISLTRPLRMREIRPRWYAVDGTPTDSTWLGVNHVLQDRPPEIVVSGINHGPNLADDVIYSGTVAAAMEATVMGIPAVALSFSGAYHEEIEGWEDVVRGILRSVLGREGLPADTLFNVNLPAVAPGEVRGIKVTSLGQRRYADSITRAKDPSGREYFWIGGGVASWRGAKDSDFQAVEDGYVSVTPLHLDLTNYELLEEIRAWDLTL
jgi:5'-nucleotidase